MRKGNFVIALIFFNASAMAEVTPSGKQVLAIVPQPPQICVSCHGVAGEGIEPVGPRLAGLSHEYISQQIHHFLSGNRQNASMGPMAMTKKP